MESLICFGTYHEYLKDQPRIRGFVREVDSSIVRFENEEITVKFKESLRDKHLFIFGETSCNLTELLLTIDAAQRSSVQEITIVLPYYGYSRQDKREGNRGCLGASLIAHVLQSFGIRRLITIDLHAEQIQGFFRGIPVEHIHGKNIFLEGDFLKDTYKEFNIKIEKTDEIVICSPDDGGTERARRISTTLDLRLVGIEKHRDKPGSIGSMNLKGNVKDTHVIIVDDMADSCGTLCKAAELLKEHGAKSVIAVTTHPILSPKAKNNLETAQFLDGIILSDTLNRKEFLQDLKFKYKIYSCLPILDQVVKSISKGHSLSILID